jgi:hypothetical protein
MNRASIAVAMACFLGLAPSGLRAQDEAKQKDRSAPAWRAFGRVTDEEGRPMAGVEIGASCGMGTLRRTGSATSGEDGRYQLDFGPGIMFLGGGSGGIQAATISAHKPGYSEVNLSRQGGCVAAGAEPDEKTLQRLGGRKDRLFLPGKPLELDFTMRPSGRVAGKLVDEQGKPLAGYSVALGGAELPPSSSVVSYVYADRDGRFVMDDIPTNYRFQFEVRRSDPKPPWDDSWASAAMRFDRPESGDLRAWFGDQELSIEDFTLRVAGPGVHGRIASRVAGNIGVLDLTADASAVQERTGRRVAARAAVLTLRNDLREAPAGSLIASSVPAAPAEPSSTRLARTRPDATGAFTISFENPRGFELERGKHQVIFQVLVGISQKPIREKIFRQLEIEPGRYTVPVKIRPEWIDDSCVSITFVTIQPHHDDWVRSFFLEGKGTTYRGLWTGDGGLMPEIAFEPAGR